MVGLGVSALMATVYAFQPFIYLLVANKVFDTILESSHNETSADGHVIVEIDDDSLTKYGQWPWPRYRIANLIEKINEAGAEVVGLDIVFSEHDRTSPANYIKDLNDNLGISVGITGLPIEFQDNDQILSKTLSKGKNVLGFKFLYAESDTTDNECSIKPVNVIFRTGGSDVKPESLFFNASNVVCPLEELVTAATRSGFIDIAPDVDGVFRRAPLLIHYKGKLYPSLALAPLLISLNLNQVIVDILGDSIESITIGDTVVPVDKKGNLLIHYRGGARFFEYISASDILDGSLKPDRLKDKIVYIGATAAGLKELRATPLSPVTPGVEINVNIADNILAKDFIYRPHYIQGLELIMILILGLFSTALLVLAKAGRSMLIVVVVAICIWFAAEWIFATSGLFIQPLWLLVTLAGNYTVLTLFKYIYEERKTLRRTLALVKTQNVTIGAMSNLVEHKDAETGAHINRTQHYVLALANHLKAHDQYSEYLDEFTVDLIFKLAPLHDIGKVGIPDSILLKKGKLTFEEFEIMKKHTTYGNDAFKLAEKEFGENPFFEIAKEIINCHQEKWDGSGYPNQLKGDKIPVAGRIMAIADVYDALICKRPYKEPMSHQSAIDIMTRGRGTHFDPVMLDAFLEIKDTFMRIADEFNDNGNKETSSLKNES